MADPTTSDTTRRLHPAWTVALVALTTVVLAQALRTLFPAAYDLAEDWDKRLAGLVVVVAFLAPVVAPLFRRVFGPRGALAVAVGALVAARAALQWVGRPSFALALTTAVLGVIALPLLLAAVRRDGTGARLFTAGLVAGLGLDAGLRLAFGTWDLVWRRGADQWGAQLAVVALLAALVVALVQGVRARLAADGEPSRHAFVPALLVGPYLFLELLFLASPAFVAAAGGRSLAAAGVVTVGGLTLALALAGPVATRLGSHAVRVGLGLLVAAGAFVLPDTTGLALVALVLVMQLVASALVAAAMQVETDAPRVWRLFHTATGTAVGGFTLGLCVLGFQFHYEQPLPFTNRFFPALAGALLALAATGRIRDRAPTSVPVRRVVHAAAIALAALTIAVPVWLVATEPALASAHGLPARVMTYNVHGGVSRSGQLDAEGLAHDIQRADADVVAVQETPRGWPVGGMLDFPDWVQRRLGYRYVWGAAADHQFGNLLLSRYPILEAKVVSLPHAGARMKRSAIVATLDTGNGTTLHVVAAHTQDGTSPDRKAARLVDNRKLARLATPQPETVLLGDLNSDPSSPELQALLDAGLTTPMDTRRCTMRTSNDNCVDWILVTPDLKLTDVHTMAIDRSDHHPLVGTVSR